MAIETIPLPSESITHGETFEVTAVDLTAWPGQKLRVEFEYNSHMNRWLWRAFHIGEGQIVRTSVATLDYQYDHWPYVLFEFRARGGAGGVDAITPDTLGEQVRLAVFPGPLGGDFLQDSGLTAAEERDLLTWGNLTRDTT